MTKISDFPSLQRKQTLPGAFSLEGVSCTLCRVGPYSITKLCQLYLRHKRAFLLPTSVLSMLLAAEATFPTSGTIQTFTTGWSRSESTDVAAQWSSPPRQQKEVHHLGEKKREHPCYTIQKCPATLYCHQPQICIGKPWSKPAGHTLLFKSFRGLGGYLQVLVLQHLFPSQSWRWTSLFSTVKHQSKVFFFPPQPLQLHLQDSTPEWECCRRVMAKIITERVSVYKELHKGWIMAAETGLKYIFKRKHCHVKVTF